MKLNELTGVKKFKDHTIQDLLNHTFAEFKAGNSTLRPLGHGANAVALTNGKKVFKFWFTDPAYEEYIDFCNKYKGNPLLPVFESSIRTLPKFFTINHTKNSAYNRVKFVRMELLSRYTGGDGLPFFTGELAGKARAASEMGNYISIREIFEWGTNFGKDNEDNLLIVFDEIQRGLYDTEFPYEKYIKQLNPDLVNLVKTIGLMSAELGPEHYDYRRSNMAMRGRQMVILDPLVDSKAVDANLEILKMYELEIPT